MEAALRLEALDQSFMNSSVIDQRVLAVYFDEEELVSQLANYGLKDGQVFDFVSCTTPTGWSAGSIQKGWFRFAPIHRKIHRSTTSTSLSVRSTSYNN